MKRTRGDKIDSMDISSRIGVKMDKEKSILTIYVKKDKSNTIGVVKE